MHTLKNDKLEITIKQIGAELCKIKSAKHNTNFMWDGNPNIWNGISPVLFPIIGALKDGSYNFNGADYKLPKHGFIRHNENMLLDKKNSNSLIFKLGYNEALLKMYPFKFEFYISYLLKDNTLEVTHTVKNRDNKTIYFSVGGHPAFKCPVFDDETYNDYKLELEHNETAKRHLINLENGLIADNTEPVFNDSNIIKLRHDLFDNDALVFKNLRSRKVTLMSNKYGAILTVSYPDFPYLGIWAKPEGDFVCIEPWLGIADSETTNQDFKTKEGILTLVPNKLFKASYTIEINNSLLV
ncbi:aldose 1-epimerase family protein [Aestuariivivens insulae]|uniref:aldose 1-epimerase family protein n=1 Tax=Aestuariivivens insulae TaxID=1621988 RepID=UPI001F5A2E57|nr:aldose 1-epimerase family protein [Aestuariivivens insulae]